MKYVNEGMNQKIPLEIGNTNWKWTRCCRMKSTVTSLWKYRLGVFLEILSVFENNLRCL